METVKRHKETAQQTHHDAQINTVLEVRVQVVHLKVQLVQMFVHKRDQRLPNRIWNELFSFEKIQHEFKTKKRVINLFHDAQFGGIAVEQGIEGITLASHSNVIVLRCQLLLVFPVK